MTTKFGPGTCVICGNLPENPYRRQVGGVIVEGCISDAHTGHLYGSSLAWHNRPIAVAHRKSIIKRDKVSYGAVCATIRA